MKKLLAYLLSITLFLSLTVLTQVGGLIYLVALLLATTIGWGAWWKTMVVFLLLYTGTTFLVLPTVAPHFGRVRITHAANLQPANYFTSVLLNRNYVTPTLDGALSQAASQLGPNGHINYLDANFPFYDGFPLLPHLSHNDGRKVDLSLAYETASGVPSRDIKSTSGYGVYEGPAPGELDQIERCVRQGYAQYSFTQYLTLGQMSHT
ncbi:hypothetical protein LEM8419_01972 [Neolewinella maritima]|uniref:Uncharacterized protein n=1 Tax=Neolewinella maritima TaxID=1383882 RepID=A0ABN8F944_9BACT|nr:hypothetical protein [Neolewinella maritima]CAH1000962.1 hypothetical protein LEM8419_01972 [Neolewinella maritima]